MGSGMDSYWRGKKLAEEERLLEIKFNDFFEIVEDKNKKGKPIFRLKFKLNGQLLPNGMTNKPDDIKKLGWRWLKKNEREANDMIFEHTVLGENK